MHVDDRLATVLAVRATGENQVRVQFRQLLDLIGTTAADARGDLVDAALIRLAELARTIPVDVRARAVAEPGLRLRNPRLVADLAHDHPRVALAAIDQARLTEEQWLDLLPVLPAAARARLRQRAGLGTRLRQRLDQLGDSPAGLPASAAAMAAAAVPQPADKAGPDGAAPTTGDGIGAIVRRIAAYRRHRDTTVPANDAPQLPLNPEAAGTPIGAFTFACDPGGRIISADAAVAGMTVGLLLPFAGDPGSAPGKALGNTIGERFAHRQPIRLAPITLQGSPRIAGDWVLDALPEFDGAGRFTGYVGKLRRPAEPLATPPARSDDRLRQVLHELRTPVNAIQGFAELIQQQLVGPVPHGYRAVAAGIAADAAQMLAGFEELDRLVKLETGSGALSPGSCDLAAVAARTEARLTPFTAPRQSGFALASPGPSAPIPVAMAEAEAERLLWRLFATCASQAAPGEVLAVTCAPAAGAVTLTVTLPVALAEAEDPLDTAPPAIVQPVSGSLFGSGFALRLASAEAAAAGGSLTLRDGKALLVLPLPGSAGLTEPCAVSNPVPQASASTAG